MDCLPVLGQLILLLARSARFFGRLFSWYKALMFCLVAGPPSTTTVIPMLWTSPHLLHPTWTSYRVGELFAVEATANRVIRSIDDLRYQLHIGTSLRSNVGSVFIAARAVSPRTDHGKSVYARFSNHEIVDVTTRSTLVQLVLVGLKHIVDSLLRCRFAFAHHFGNLADQEFPRAI